MKTFIGLFLLLTLSCPLLHGAGDRIFPQRMKAELMYRGFSVKRPTDKKQFIEADSNSSVDMVFHREPDSPTHSFFCRVILMNLSGKVTTAAELEAVVREGFSRPSTRNVITRIETKITTRQGQPAVEYQVEYEDHGAIIPGVKLLAAYIRGIAILHPTLADTYVDATYSESGLPEEIAKRKMDIPGQEFLTGVSLYDTPKRRTKAK